MSIGRSKAGPRRGLKRRFGAVGGKRQRPDLEVANATGLRGPSSSRVAGRSFAPAVLPLFCVLSASFAQAGSTTVTTTYEYNADGALTQVTESTAGQGTVTTYLTWDNFVPDAGDATSGTVLAGNGNLLGYGPSPGETGLATTFAYDERNRLVDYGSDAGGVSYTYDAQSMMGVASSPEERVHFYYDTGSVARVTNMRSESSGLSSRELGPLRHVTDGSEQMVLHPQKDVAGTYDPATGSYTPYAYDPYGASSGGCGSGLGVEENPFRYAGEWQDPAWCGVYLRERWYAPELPTFLTRDPAANLSRYGYGDGDPRNRVDPTGRTSVHFGSMWKKWNRGGGKFMRTVVGGKGWRGITERLLFGGPLGVMSVFAQPKGFWQSIKGDHYVGAAFMGVSIFAEVALDRDIPGMSYKKMFAARIGADALLGVSQSAVSASGLKGHHFDRQSFFEGVEYTVGGIMMMRLYTSRGYRPDFNMSYDDVQAKWEAFGRRPGEMDVFEFRRSVGNPLVGGTKAFLQPLRESVNLGGYHLGLIAVGDRDMLVSNLGDNGLLLGRYSAAKEMGGLEVTQLPEELEYRYVGRRRIVGGANEPFFSNPLRADVFRTNVTPEEAPDVKNPDPYSPLRRNCQDHVSRVLENMRGH